MVVSKGDSLCYANINIDYKDKSVKMDYPHKDKSDLIHKLLFGFIGAGLGLILSVIIISPTSNGVEEIDAVVFFAIIIICTILFSNYVSQLNVIKDGCIKSSLNYRDMNMIYLSSLSSKKISIYNVDNYYTEYETEGDFSKYISSFKIKCTDKAPKKDFLSRLLSLFKYNWMIEVEFDEVPKVGKMVIYYQNDNNFSVDPDKKVELVEGD